MFHGDRKCECWPHALTRRGTMNIHTHNISEGYREMFLECFVSLRRRFGKFLFIHSITVFAVAVTTLPVLEFFFCNAKLFRGPISATETGACP